MTVAAAAFLIAAAPLMAHCEGNDTSIARAAPSGTHAEHEMAMQPRHEMPGHPEHEETSTPASEADAHDGHHMQMDASGAADPHAGHHMTMPAEETAPSGAHPPEALTGPEHAADTIFPADVMERSRTATMREMGAMTSYKVMFDRLELQSGKGDDVVLWDANAWVGGDIDKLWLKSEGELATSGPVEEAEVQALWSHAIGPWFDLQAGLRYDFRPEPDRAHLALGVQGLAPYFIEVDAAAFLSEKGDLTARIEAEYDQRITQRLIAQPRVEVDLAAQDIPELGTGSGVTSLQAGLRLRYELAREFAPYVGVEWQRALGRTARYSRLEGDDPDRVRVLAGIRAWF